MDIVSIPGHYQYRTSLTVHDGMVYRLKIVLSLQDPTGGRSPVSCARQMNVHKLQFCVLDIRFSMFGKEYKCQIYVLRCTIDTEMSR